MGIHWFKHKPKKVKRPSDRPRVALNLDDLQIQDSDQDADDQGDDSQGEGDQGDETQPEDTDTEPGEEGTPEEGDDTEETPTASETVDVAEETASATEPLRPELNDPIIISLQNLKRNPFERSPYAQLVEDLRAQEEAPEETEEKKATELIQANFTATIKTRKELVAVIDSRLYRKGDRFRDNVITGISNEIVSLDTSSKLFLIPKVGVQVQIATDGTYTFEDSYMDRTQKN
jgi:hypothetical protein